MSHRERSSAYMPAVTCAAGQKLGKSFAARSLHSKHKGPVSGAFAVAGAGFEQTSATAYRFLEIHDLG